MNIYIGWLFKLIPLIMGLICIALGGFVLESSGQSEYFVAGHVLISLAAICLALFTTAFRGSCADFSGGHMPGIIHYRIYYHFAAHARR
ncbi:DUF2776 domain-containing protein [Escherichia coli]|nr:DUF2776 domain-containing protein [Escherichia coli]